MLFGDILSCALSVHHDHLPLRLGVWPKVLLAHTLSMAVGGAIVYIGVPRTVHAEGLFVVPHIADCIYREDTNKARARMDRANASMIPRAAAQNMQAGACALQQTGMH